MGLKRLTIFFRSGNQIITDGEESKLMSFMKMVQAGKITHQFDRSSIVYTNNCFICPDDIEAMTVTDIIKSTAEKMVDILEKEHEDEPWKESLWDKPDDDEENR